MLYNRHFFSSKCRLFHNATLFGFCITHILNTGCAKIWKKVRRQKVNTHICSRTSRSRSLGLNEFYTKKFPNAFFFGSPFVFSFCEIRSRKERKYLGYAKNKTSFRSLSSFHLKHFCRFAVFENLWRCLLCDITATALTSSSDSPASLMLRWTDSCFEILSLWDAGNLFNVLTLNSFKSSFNCFPEILFMTF